MCAKKIIKKYISKESCHNFGIKRQRAASYLFPTNLEYMGIKVSHHKSISNIVLSAGT